ncbi:GNAT family N-acetyltransferase [Paenibacillus silviterrae]|uniref:GNAT family N-acetyltransferase n=1 Tax=Paenibacillus silviterrae TaxID=3242194 RepID=UPI002542C1E5|nr:GNAT family protein [Paenibacillus chinjuensis]
MNFETFPTVETERFILRQLTTEDAPAVLKLFSDAAVTKDMGIDPFTSITEAVGLILFMNELFKENKAFRWGICNKADQTLIGTCGFNGWETQRGARGEIAYDLGREYWRQGYMTEVLKEAISFGFNMMGLHRIEAFTNLDATPSLNLLIKLGFKEEGVLRGYSTIHGEYADQRCFSLLKNEWE